MSYKGLNRSPNSITENALSVSAAFGPLTIAANQALSGVLDSFVLPVADKIVRIAATAHTVSGSPTIQVVVGTGPATGSPALADTYATIGTTLFSAPITLTCNNNTGQTIPTAIIDAQYHSGQVLTLRALSGAGDVATGLKINITHTPIAEQGPETVPQLGAFGPSSF